MGKKNKRTGADAGPELNATNGHCDDSQNAKKLKKKKNTEKEKVKDQDEAGKQIPTVSIAVPASIIDNVPTLDLATRVTAISNAVSFYFIFKNNLLLFILPHIYFFFFSWLVKSLVPQLFFESTRLLMLSTFSHLTLFIYLFIIALGALRERVF